jgi:hypothetical protein
MTSTERRDAFFSPRTLGTRWSASASTQPTRALASYGEYVPLGHAIFLLTWSASPNTAAPLCAFSAHARARDCLGALRITEEALNATLQRCPRHYPLAEDLALHALSSLYQNAIQT